MSRFVRASRWFKRSSRVLQGSLVALALAVPAVAADWSLRFGASETLTFDDNLGLSEVNRDAALTSSTSFDLDLLARGKTYRIKLQPTLSVQKTFFSQEPDEWSYYPGGTLSLSKSTKRTTYDLVASFARSEASANELIEDIITGGVTSVTEEGDQLNYAVTGTVTHKVNALNTLIWSNAASLVDYTLPSDDLVPSVTLTSTATWRRELSELVTGNVTASADYYDPDSATVDGRILYRARAGVDARLSKRLSVSGAAGVVLLDPDSGDLAADVIFNVGVDYKLKTTSYSFSAARDLSPSQDGSLRDSYSARLGAVHQVNDRTTLALSAAYTFQNGEEDGDSSAFTISPSLNHQLTRDWTTSLSYRFIQSNDATTSAHSNAVTLTLSYGTFLLP